MAFALVTITMNILNASGRPLVAWGLVALIAGLAAVVVPLGVGTGDVRAAASASIGALWFGALVSLVMVWRIFGASLSLKTALVGAGVALTLLIPIVWEPRSGQGGCACCSGELRCFSCSAWLGGEDLALARRVAGQRCLVWIGDALRRARGSGRCRLRRLIGGRR